MANFKKIYTDLIQEMNDSLVPVKNPKKCPEIVPVPDAPDGGCCDCGAGIEEQADDEYMDPAGDDYDDEVIGEPDNIVIKVSRDEEYSPNDLTDTITVGELIDTLGNYTDASKVYLEVLGNHYSMYCGIGYSDIDISEETDEDGNYTVLIGVSRDCVYSINQVNRTIDIEDFINRLQQFDEEAKVCFEIYNSHVNMYAAISTYDIDKAEEEY